VPPQLASLAQLVLTDTPRLRGARCRDYSAELFDLPDHPRVGRSTREDVARLAVAVAICEGCPALLPCSNWLASLAPDRRPSGVVAAQVVRRRVSRDQQSAVFDWHPPGEGVIPARVGIRSRRAPGAG